MRQNQNKTKLPKYHWVLCVCVGRLLLAVEPALKCGMYMQWDSPGEAQFSFLLCEWLSTKAPGLGLGTPVYFSVSALGPPLLWTWTGPMHDAPGSVHTCMYRVHTSVSPVGCGRHCFLGIIHSLWLVQSFCLPQCSLIPEGKASPEGSVLSGFERQICPDRPQHDISFFFKMWTVESQKGKRTIEPRTKLKESSRSSSYVEGKLQKKIQLWLHLVPVQDRLSTSLSLGKSRGYKFNWSSSPCPLHLPL